MEQTSTPTKKELSRSLMTVACAVALLLFAVNCAFSSGTAVTPLPYVTLVAFFTFTVITTRSKATVIGLAAPAVLGLLFMPLPSLSYFCAGIGVVAIVAAAIRSKQYVPLIALPVAFGICLAVSGDPVFSLGTLFFLPPAIVMGILLRKKAKRGTLIAATAGALLVLPVATLLAFAYGETGSLSLSFFTDYIDAFRTALVTEMVPLLEEFGATNAEETLVASFNLVLRLLPAICIVLCEVLAYLTTVLALPLADTDKAHPLPLHTRLLRMETTSAVVFLIALVLAFLLRGMDGTAGVLGVSALNLVLILLPGLALHELVQFLVRFRAGRTGILFPILLCFIMGALVLPLLALLGAIHLIRDSRIQRKDNGDDI